MKKSSLSFLAILAVTILFSCKKDVSPKLLVTIVDGQDQAVQFSWIEISVNRSNQGVINPEVIDSTKTNEFGKAFFEFKNTVIVDVGLFASEFSTVKVDSTTVLLETKRGRDEDGNVTERKLVFR